MTTPMNLQYPVPGVGGTSGPLWAQQVNNNFGLVEAHDHTSGKGSQLVVASLSIDADLPLNGFNATELRSARLVNFASAGIFAAATADKSCIFSVGGELYYRDQAGNSVQITSAGGVAGTPGSIGGLVAPAAVSWGALAGNLAFFADTGANTGMNLVAGGVSFADPAAGGMAGNLINIVAPSSPSAYTLKWPAAVPAVNQSLRSDASGNFSWVRDLGRMPVGSVIATFPNLTGAYDCTATTAADAAGFVKCGGQTISDATSPMNGQVVPNINNDVFLMGNATSGTADGSNTLIDHAHTLNNLGGAGVAFTVGEGPSDFFTATFRGSAVATTATAYATLSVTGTSATAASGASSAAINGVQLYGTTAGITTTPDSRPKFITARYIMIIK